MTAAYRAWLRACSRMQCNPAVVLVAVLILAVALGVSKSVATSVSVHRAQILAGLTAAAAIACVAAAAVILAACATALSRVSGQHTDILPDYETVTPPRTAPATVPGYHPAYTLRTQAETDAMRADADALADEETGIVVSENGTVYELAGPGEAEL